MSSFRKQEKAPSFSAVKESIDGFHRRLKMLGFPSYKHYLESEHWFEVRQQYQRERPWECGFCGSKHNLQLHHRTYENLGAEQAFLWQLIPLCERHHTAVHRWSRRHRATVAKATRVLLARSKRKPRAPKDATMSEAVNRLLDEAAWKSSPVLREPHLNPSERGASFAHRRADRTFKGFLSMTGGRGSYV